MHSRPQNHASCILIAVLTLAMLPTIALAGNLEGYLSATAGDGGKYDSASFTYWNGKETIEVKVYLDKAGQQLAKLANGREVQISGSFFSKKKEKYLKVKSFAIVYVGLLSVTRDDKKKVTAVKYLSEDNKEEFPLVLDGAVRKMAEKASGQKFWIVGALVTVKKVQSLKAKSIAEILTLKGDMKSIVDKKGNVRGAKFTVVNGKKKTLYGILLNGKGRELAQNYPKGSVEITGIRMGKVIRVLSFQ